MYTREKKIKALKVKNVICIVIGLFFGVKYSSDVPPLSPEATKLIERVKEIKNVE